MITPCLILLSTTLAGSIHDALLTCLFHNSDCELKFLAIIFFELFEAWVEERFLQKESALASTLSYYVKTTLQL